MRRALLSILLATALIGASAVAAPALSTQPYVPEPVDFEVAPTGAAAGQKVGGKVVSRPLDAPKRFDVVGVRWTQGDAETGVELRVRREGEGWSDWAEATRDPDHAPDPKRGEGNDQRVSSPVWAGGADEVQYRTSERLAGLKVEFINSTGTATAADRAKTAVRKAANRSVTGVAGLFSASAEAPAMVSRAQWGGDRYCKPRTSPETGSVKAVFVHHTVNANSYSSSEAASMVLGICRYHRDSNGWNDIGYNFLVDRYGRIYEGRDGGVGAAIVGAQAQGWNAQSTGVANLGTFSSYGQTSAGLRALDRIISWKLDRHGVQRGGTATLTSAGGETTRYSRGTQHTFKRISGHRDGNNTTCPGGALYDQLPRLRDAVESDGDTTAPARPTNLTARGGAGRISLDWADNKESDLAGYRVYRRAAEDADYKLLKILRPSSYDDVTVEPGKTYYYRVKAYDSSGNWSLWTASAAGAKAMPAGYEQIIDNSDSARFTASSAWRSSDWSPIKYGYDYRYAGPQSASDAASFRLRAPRAGSYAVYIRHPVNEKYSSSAPIGVKTSKGTTWTRLDLRKDGGRWLSLGNYALAAGEEPRVLVSRWTSASGWLIADAARLLER